MKSTPSSNKKTKSNKLISVVFTMQEKWAASRHIVFKNKKKYNRKDSNKGPFYISHNKFGYLENCSYISTVIKS